MIDQFEEATQKIFEEAGAKMTPFLHDQIYNQLSGLMATLSATEGLAMSRVEMYDKQKKAFIQDIKDGIASGDVESK